jgi:hypothetical protein
VVEALAMRETSFFRDRTPFEDFTGRIVPALLASRTGERRIRIWCAAASTGQEPYSVAMCLAEIAPQLAGWQIDIVATDLSCTALEKAAAGTYSGFEVQRANTSCTKTMAGGFRLTSAPWCSFARSTCCTIFPRWAGSTWCSAATCWALSTSPRGAMSSAASPG